MRRTLILLVLAALVAGSVLDFYYNGLPGMAGSLYEVLDPLTESTVKTL